jgi:hypothetical protein
MSGGIIVTDDEGIAAVIEKEYAALERPRFGENVREVLKALLLAVFIRPSLYWLPAGLPFLGLGETIFTPEFPVNGLSGVRAGLMRNWRKRLEKSNQRRKENGEYFCNIANLNNLRHFSIPFLRLPYLTENEKLRDNIYSCLHRKGVSMMYPSSINKIRELKDQFASAAYPTAEGIASRLLTIPTHELISENDKAAIMAFLLRFHRPLINTDKTHTTPTKPELGRRLVSGGNHG